jgi:hypothetical protein
MTWRWFAVVALALFACGCGRAPERGEVEGVVTLNGAPLEGVQVAFTLSGEGEAGNLRSIAVTDSAGKYRLHGDQGEAGAVVGQYTVVITDARALRVPGSKQKPPPSRVPSQYTTISSTPLKAEVKAGFQTINLDLVGTRGKDKKAP